MSATVDTAGADGFKMPPGVGVVADQLTGAFVDSANSARKASEAVQLSVQQTAFEMAQAEMVVPRLFLEDPSRILGSAATKHGEVAEVVEVGVRRALDVLHQQTPSATDATGRTAAEDYFLNGIPVQSKFYNGTNNSLGGVLEHMDKYPAFGRDGSYYVIPKDQFEQIKTVLGGDTDGLSEKTVRALLVRARKIEELSGKKFDEVVKPASITYAEAQIVAVPDTLDSRDEELAGTNGGLKADITTAHLPGWQEGLQVSANAAAAGAVFGFVTGSARKFFYEDKNIFKGQFTMKDWAEVGLDAGAAGLAAGVSAAVIYGLTNYANVAAPLAASFVSASRGVGSLVASYHAGALTRDELIDQSFLVCADTAIVGLCTVAAIKSGSVVGAAMGQTLIPLPCVGAVLGALAGKVVAELLLDQVPDVQQLIDAMHAKHKANLSAADAAVCAALEAKYLPVQSFTAFAFDVERNEQLLDASIALSRLHGVDDRLVLKNEDDVLAFLKAPASGVAEGRTA